MDGLWAWKIGAVRETAKGPREISREPPPLDCLDGLEGLYLRREGPHEVVFDLF